MVAAPAVVEDILTGTDRTTAAITTPVAIPTGMTTCGLDIVVKLDASSLCPCELIRLSLTLSSTDLFHISAAGFLFFPSFITCDFKY